MCVRTHTALAPVWQTPPGNTDKGSQHHDHSMDRRDSTTIRTSDVITIVDQCTLRLVIALY